MRSIHSVHKLQKWILLKEFKYINKLNLINWMPQFNNKKGIQIKHKNLIIKLSTWALIIIHTYNWQEV